MDILNKLTIKNLKLNKKRTIVTIIGIILATALITAITTLIASFQSSTLAYTKKHYGDYHLVVANVPVSDLSRIQNLDNIESTFITQNEGVSVYNDEQYVFPVQMLNFSDGALQNLGIELVDGWLPENENEVVISSQLVKNENLNLAIGSRITLPIPGEENKTKDYSLVGIVNITNQQIEPMTSATASNKCYTFISHIDNNNLSGNYDIYLRFSNLASRIDTLVNILEMDEDTYKELKAKTVSETEENILENESNKYECVPNNNLIMMELGDDYDQTAQMLYTVAIVVLIIIILISAYCIKNSFSISITEKVKQYGMLASIGTTPKQIRRNVLYEALILGIIGIPIGILLGIGSIYLLLQFIQNKLTDQIFGMKFIFSTNIIAIAFAIVFSALTVYLSARKSAKIASKISPMEAIMSNKDIKIKSKKIKSPKWIKKLFGVGGVIAYKNLKRNKRSYRTTVVSLIMSISAFIAIITFNNYAFETVDLYYANYDFNIYISGKNYDDLLEITQDSNIKTYSIVRQLSGQIVDGKNHFSNDAKTLDTKNDFADYPYIDLVVFGRQEYERYINKLGLNYEDVKDKGILLDYITSYAEIDGKDRLVTFRIYDYQKGDNIEISSSDNEQKFPIEIAEVTNKEPLGTHGINSGFPTAFYATLVISDELFDEYTKSLDSNYIRKDANLYIVTDNSKELIEYIKENYSDNYYYIENVDNIGVEQRAIYTAISIFLYTFIIITALIGITNIFNTITTSMELRQKEFAHLKSIGMTKKEFNRMIMLENVFLGFKSLIIGIPLGLVFSYIVHIEFSTNVVMEYMPPINGIIISIVAVSIILGLIMLYALRKINKQNIIETIRRDNV